MIYRRWKPFSETRHSPSPFPLPRSPRSRAINHVRPHSHEQGHKIFPCHSNSDSSLNNHVLMGILEVGDANPNSRHAKMRHSCVLRPIPAFDQVITAYIIPIDLCREMRQIIWRQLVIAIVSARHRQYVERKKDENAKCRSEIDRIKFFFPSHWIHEMNSFVGSSLVRWLAVIPERLDYCNHCNLAWVFRCE